MSKSSEEGAVVNGSGQETGNGAPKDANGNIYENRAGTKKIIRVVTVMAYVFSVSFAAILLSAYYVFLWEPPNPRLQRHPLSGDPQVEFLTDNLSSRKNFTDLNDADDDPLHSSAALATIASDLIDEGYENPSRKFNNILFERIMTSSSDLHREEPARNEPQRLIAFQDFAESLQHPPASDADADAASTTRSEDQSGASTTLPIFLKSLGAISTELSRGETEGRNVGEFGISMIEKYNDDASNVGGKNGSKNSRWSSPPPPAAEIMNNETTSTPAGSTESDTLSVTSTWDLEGTIYPRIDKPGSYPDTIGATVKNNKVTIGTDITIEAPISTSRIPAAADLQDENFDTVSLRKLQDSSMSAEDPDNEIKTRD